MVLIVYTLEKPEWLLNSGISKGLNHDKQALGIILQPGTTIRVKLLNPSTELNLQMELLNNDRAKEHYITISNKPAEFTTTYESVPFISTPYTPTPTQIELEVEFSTNTTTLPTYKTKTDTYTFFKQWDDQQSAFALITTQYADILVPQKDKESLRAINNSNGLDSFETYYNNIFELYNSLAGLSLSPTSNTDKNLPNRYFMKADISGPGSAYYGNSHTAQSNDSTAAFWLDTSPKNWGSLHEIGHGYQGYFMSQSPLLLGEVWNNIYAVFYQKKYMGDDFLKDSWIYQGNSQAAFDLLEKIYEDSNPTKPWNVVLILLFLVQLFEKAGETAFVEFNKNYRTLSNKSNFKAENQPTFEVIADACARTANQDIGPILLLVNIPITIIAAVLLQYSNHKPLVPLYKTIEKNNIDAIKLKLKLSSQTSLTDCIELKQTDLSGNLELQLNKTVYEEIKNKEILLKNGSNLSTIIQIIQPTTTINNLPIGNYTLLCPTAPNGKYIINTQYITIQSNSTTKIELEYHYKTGCSIASQQIQLGGLSGIFSTINVDTGYNKITIDVTQPSPHSYFKDQIYATITIKDRNQRIVFYKEMPGINTTPSTNQIPYGTGYTLEIFHQEPSRLSISPSDNLTIDTNDKNNLLDITIQGLYNRKLSTPTDENLAITIEKATTLLVTKKHQLLYDRHPLKEDIYLAIETFNIPIRSQLLERCKILNPFHESNQSTVLIGDIFSWHQYGLSYPIAHINIDLPLHHVYIETFTVKPHNYFNSIYLAIWVINKEGNILLCQEFHGNTVAEASSITLPFHEGYELRVLHLEPSRSPLTDLRTNVQTQVNQIQAVRALEGNRIQVMPSPMT